MDYSTFDVADFAADRFFVTWVLDPDQESDDFWRRWSTGHPDRKHILREARLAVLLMQSHPETFHREDKASVWDKIQSEAFPPRMMVNKVSPRASKRYNPLRPTWFKAAASLMLLAVFSYAAVILMNKGVPDVLVAENSKGKKSIIYLPDGTKVWLNAESRITYPSSFQHAHIREVTLVGEAFFDVTENLSKPFVVKTPDLQVKVLGTSFNVKSYEREKTTSTTLVHGKVMIELNEAGDSQEDAPMILTKNQQAVYSSDSRELSLHTVEAEAVASWKEGKLVIANKPISEIEIELERWYGVEIIIEDEADDDCRFSTTIENEPITRILELFRTTSDITYTINDNLITLKGNLCP